MPSNTTSPRRLPFLCECSSLTCTETIELDPATYDAIAANALHFIVKPEHRLDEIENVIAEHETFYVVEKIGEACTEVEREHPRRGTATRSCARP